MNPEQLLANVLAVYASAPTYRDTGRIVTCYTYPPGYRGRPDGVQEFNTAFVRPDRLRVEHWHLRPDQQRLGHAIGWAKGGDACRWSQLRPGVTPTTGLASTMRLTLGIFGRTALAVHELLLPDSAQYSWLTALVDLLALKDEPLEGARCYRLRAWCAWWGQPVPEEAKPVIERIHAVFTDMTGKAVTPGRSLHLPLTLWIDTETCLVRRIESGTIEDRYCVETTTTFQPEVGVAIPESALAFDPPG